MAHKRSYKRVYVAYEPSLNGRRWCLRSVTRSGKRGRRLTSHVSRKEFAIADAKINGYSIVTRPI